MTGWVLAAALALAAPQISNDRVKVTEQRLDPGETLRATLPAVFIYFERGSLEIQAAGKSRTETVGRGDADAVWGAAGLSPNYKVLFENRHARVYDIKIPVGGREPLHTHKDRVIVCLAGAEIEHILPDGRKEPVALRAGEIGWRAGDTHIGRNAGKTALWVVAVEPK